MTKPDKRPAVVITLLVATIFLMTISGVILIKWHEPSTDATFVGVMASMSLSMAGFLAMHFKQRQIETKLNDVPTKEDVNLTASNLAEKTRDVTAKQTEQLRQQTKEIVESVVKNGH